jgi:hypothetical protein
VLSIPLYEGVADTLVQWLHFLFGDLLLASKLTPGGSHVP